MGGGREGGKEGGRKGGRERGKEGEGRGIVDHSKERGRVGVHVKEIIQAHNSIVLLLVCRLQQNPSHSLIVKLDDQSHSSKIINISITTCTHISNNKYNITV